MIGVIGGYGNIGIEVCEILKRTLDEKLRICGRNFCHASKRAKDLLKNEEWFLIKESSENEWNCFFHNCRAVLCCANLDNKTIRLINGISIYNNCPVVYMNTNKQETDLNEDKGIFIYGAGSIPGLSGILPQYGAKEFDLVKKFDFYYGAKAIFTHTAAKDYMEGVVYGDSKSMVMWKNGKISPYVKSVKTGIQLNKEFKGTKYFPYFDKESELISRKFQLDEGRWHMCIAGEHTLKVMDRARFDYKNNKEKTLNDICIASKLDCFGATSYARFVCGIEGIISNKKLKKNLILECKNPSRLTGSVAAATILLCVEHKMERGSYFLSESKNNLDIIEKLLQINDEIRIRGIYDHEKDEEIIIEGEI